MTESEKDKMLSAAYALLCSFQATMGEDHQDANSVDRWLTLYEKVERRVGGADIEGVPV